VRQPHPHKADEKAAFVEEDRRLEHASLVAEINDVSWQMSTEQGRRIAFGFLDRAGLIFGDADIDEGLFNTTVGLMTAKCAKREVAWRFNHLAIRHCPEEWNTMVDENLGTNND
jgi:hypothetical protein